MQKKTRSISIPEGLRRRLAYARKNDIESGVIFRTCKYCKTCGFLYNNTIETDQFGPYRLDLTSDNKIIIIAKTCLAVIYTILTHN